MIYELIYRWRKKPWVGRLKVALLSALKNKHFLYFDYPGDPKPRHGYGKPAHPQIDSILRRHAGIYTHQLTRFRAFSDELNRIPVYASGDSATEPFWINGWLPGLDAAALYCMLAVNRPARYFEIGSGNSTKFARRAITDQGLHTRITSLDPQPRAEIDAICDRVVRQGVEAVDLTIFDELMPGDILFVDNSHRIFMNSDAAVVFFEILPRLGPGVFVHFHDIMLPFDYPPEWSLRYYSEQYVLAAYLLAGHQNFDVILPNAFVHGEPALRQILAPLWGSLGLPEPETGGGSFWIRTR
jgi:hypothetical protein